MSKEMTIEIVSMLPSKMLQKLKFTKNSEIAKSLIGR